MAEERRDASIPPVVVEPGARFEGLVVLPRSGRIEGRVEGQVVARGTLWIGEGAQVVGDVEAPEAVVAGHVEGDVRIEGRIALESTAHVRGEVTAGRLALAEGSFLEGGCRTREPGGDSSAEQTGKDPTRP